MAPPNCAHVSCLAEVGARFGTLLAPSRRGWHPRFRCADKDLGNTWRHSFYLALPFLSKGSRISSSSGHGKVHNGTTFSMMSARSETPKYRPSKESAA